MKLDPDRFPKLVEATELIAYDAGATSNIFGAFDINRFDIPYSFEELTTVEKGLCELSDEDFETVCIGDESESKEILKRSFSSKDDSLISEVLERIFETI